MAREDTAHELDDLGGTDRPPPAGSPAVARLRPSDLHGAMHTLGAVLVTGASIELSSGDSRAVWFLGQLLFGVGVVKWFSLLHEAGHHTLFSTRWLNTVAGHLASVPSILPYESWKAIHRLHHKWTGWQDIDPTTTSLVPRRLAPVERAVLNVSWRFWLPLFSVLYRAQSFWHVPKLFRLFPGRGDRARMVLNLAALAGLYAGLSLWLGPGALLELVGLGFVVGFSWLDVMMLSQHTHVPLKLSGGERVAPIAAPDQAVYTRSLRFSRWASVGVLTGFDAHELHHVYPYVPGPMLRDIGWQPANEAPAWAWIKAAKGVPADVFLFKNRDTSGLSILGKKGDTPRWDSRRCRAPPCCSGAVWWGGHASRPGSRTRCQKGWRGRSIGGRR